MSKLFSDDYVVNRGYRKLNINQTRMTTSINNAADGRKVCITISSQMKLHTKFQQSIFDNNKDINYDIDV